MSRKKLIRPTGIIIKTTIIKTKTEIKTNVFLRWQLGQWSTCSKPCGRGERTRPVVCKYMPENTTENHARVDEIMCPQPKPLSKEPCGFASCPPKWTKSGLGKVNLTFKKSINFIFS